MYLIIQILKQIIEQTDLKSRITNTEIQVKYLACAHIDLKNELAVLHQMVKNPEMFFI